VVGEQGAAFNNQLLRNINPQVEKGCQEEGASTQAGVCQQWQHKPQTGTPQELDSAPNTRAHLQHRPARVAGLGEQHLPHHVVQAAHFGADLQPQKYAGRAFWSQLRKQTRQQSVESMGQCSCPKPAWPLTRAS